MLLFIRFSKSSGHAQRPDRRKIMVETFSWNSGINEPRASDAKITRVCGHTVRHPNRPGSSDDLVKKYLLRARRTTGWFILFTQAKCARDERRSEKGEG